MEVKYKVSGNRVDIKLTGEMDTLATVEIQSKMDEIAQYSALEIVIDCESLSYIASSGLRQFITIHKKCNADGGHLRLVNVTPDIMEIFAITNFDKVFDISQ